MAIYRLAGDDKAEGAAVVECVGGYGEDAALNEVGGEL